MKTQRVLKYLIYLLQLQKDALPLRKLMRESLQSKEERIEK